ncbi:hypothetical protein [Lysobacter antibioticus]|uniref:hypothetical protein n=1 Tax=Lysobacter antibioticus TaxID=84531 RepID=UPI0007E8EB3F|nr:hypothetical protein [Lysobacter antibioticus]
MSLSERLRSIERRLDALEARAEHGAALQASIIDALSEQCHEDESTQLLTLDGHEDGAERDQRQEL